MQNAMGGKLAQYVLPKETCSEGTVLNENMRLCPTSKGNCETGNGKAEKAKKAQTMKVSGGNMKQVKKFLKLGGQLPMNKLRFLSLWRRRITSETKVGKIVSCHFTGVPDTMSSSDPSYYGRSRGVLSTLIRWARVH